eukprot:gene5783-biopygen9646
MPEAPMACDQAFPFWLHIPEDAIVMGPLAVGPLPRNHGIPRLSFLDTVLYEGETGGGGEDFNFEFASVERKQRENRARVPLQE